MLETQLNGKTPDITEENISKLKQIFPEVFTEGKIDYEKLQQVLGNHIETETERYNFSWNGKAKALRLSQTPSTGTLRPYKEESKDWDTTQNLYIEGDNLEVLKLLQKSYHSKVKMIYIDPPYNTGGDFVYPDNFTDSIENYKKITGQIDSEGKNKSNNPETSGRYHTDWLNMIYPRLRLARNLLTDDGVIFISIDDNEVDNLKKICNEVFGEENFIAQIVWEKRFTRSNNSKMFASLVDYILLYRKSADLSEIKDQRNEKSDSIYSNPDNDPHGVWTSVSYVNPATKKQRPNLVYDIINPFNLQVVSHPTNAWKYEYNRYQEQIKENKLYWGKSGENTYPRLKKFLAELDGGIVPVNLWYHKEVGTTDAASKSHEEIMGIKMFDFPKPVSLIYKMLRINTSDEDIVLDFFSGSATTAHAVMQLNAEDNGNRKFIMVQLPEPCKEDSEAFKAGYKNICEIGKERIRRAGDKIKTELAEKQSGQTTLDGDNTTIDPNSLDIGFKVLKLDSSNIRKWQPDYDNLELSLTDFISNYVDGRTELDVVYEIILKYGLDLAYPVEEHTIDGKKVYSIASGLLMICLDDDLTTDIAKGILKLKDELKPETIRVVFKDNGFNNDSNKTNIKEILKSGGVDEFVTV
jgi:adenine-specific DNA-methyltransferase